MKQLLILTLLALVLISCGQASAPMQTAQERLESEILRDEAQSTDLSDARVNYDETCGELHDSYLAASQDDFSYQIITELQSEGSGMCLLGYYYGNESGIYTYTLYNLSNDEVLEELSCEPEYDAENDIMGECSTESLQNLKMEYDFLLETHRSI